MFGENRSNGNCYRFDSFEVDCENFTIQRSGERITVTPRAFDVLVFLISNNSRVVEKQELFDEVWKDNFVSDNALTKVIKEIRRAIGDDASEPRYIETIPKRGYRFIAKTENGAEDELPEENAAIETPNGVRLPKSSRHPALLPGAVSLGAILVALGFIMFSEWRSEIIARTTPIDSIAVLPFEIEPQDPQLEFISDSIAENVNNSLSRQTNLRVLPLKTISFEKALAEDPRTIGRALRVRSVLTGKLVRRDSSISIQIELIDVERKAQIWGQQYHAEMEGIADLMDEISREAIEHFTHPEKIPETK